MVRKRPTKFKGFRKTNLVTPVIRGARPGENKMRIIRLTKEDLKKCIKGQKILIQKKYNFTQEDIIREKYEGDTLVIYLGEKTK